MARTWFRDDIGERLAERTALLAAIGSTGRTFSRGLMPRTTVGQAVATGLTGSVNYGLLVTSQSLLWAGASQVASLIMPPELPPGVDPMRAYRGRVRAISYGTYAAAALASRPLRRMLVRRPGESVGRGLARAYLLRLERASVAGAIATGVLDAAYDVVGTSDRRYRRAIGSGLMVAAGSTLAVAQVQRERRLRARFAGEPPPSVDASSVVAGSLTALGLTAAGKLEGLAAGGIGSLLEPALPPQVGRAVGHAVCLGALGAGVWQGVEHLYRNVERAGGTVEAFHAAQPTSAHVSGGPASGLDWDRLSREGRRFAGLALSASEISRVRGSVLADPVRVFVPLRAADTPEERARIAVAEMEALGAFERPVVALCSPTGTGYVNHVMAESMEYLTRGNCAIVAVQYSLRPSFLSLDRVDVGRANATALLTAVQARIAWMPEDARPRLVLFGESLGAHTGQDVALHRGSGGFAQFGIERALFIGTPEASGWARQWRADPQGTDPGGIVVEVDSYEEFAALPESRRTAARIILITHHEDPITKFGPDLAIRRPEWLDVDRERRPAGIPREIDWMPLTTFFVTVADIMNSMTVVPGQFGAEGHDYREDLARFVSVAFDLPCLPEELAAIERALRRRELQIAESRLVAEQVSAVRAAVRSKLAAWGIEAPTVDTLLVQEARRRRPAPLGKPGS